MDGVRCKTAKNNNNNNKIGDKKFILLLFFIILGFFSSPDNFFSFTLFIENGRCIYVIVSFCSSIIFFYTFYFEWIRKWAIAGTSLLIIFLFSRVQIIFQRVVNKRLSIKFSKVRIEHENLDETAFDAVLRFLRTFFLLIETN